MISGQSSETGVRQRSDRSQRRGVREQFRRADIMIEFRGYADECNNQIVLY